MTHSKLINTQKPFFSRIVANLTLIIFIMVSCTSCVSIQHRISTIDTSVENSSISLSMNLEDPDQGEVDPGLFHGVTSQLSYQNDEGKFVPITASKRGNWVLKNAMAGKYIFEIMDSSIMVDGKVKELQGGRSKSFSLRSDQRAQIKVILKKTPVGLIIVIVVLIVFVIIWYILADRGVRALPKIPLPPVPGVTVPLLPKAVPLPLIALGLPLIHHGPVPIFIDGGFYGGASYRTTNPPYTPTENISEHRLPLEATNFFPGMNSTNVPVNSKIFVFFSDSVNELSFQDLSFIRVQGSLSGSIHGKINYLPMKRRLEFLANQKFVPGEVITVTLWGQLITDDADQPMVADYEWSFTIAD